MTRIAGVEDKMEKTSKNAWLKEIEEVNQCIQVENAELRMLLQVAEDENYKLGLMLEKLVEEQVGECSST